MKTEQLEDLGVDWKIILKINLQEVGWAYELKLSTGGWRL
jgi:hypothetical protein